MNPKKIINKKRKRRISRVRAKIFGLSLKPRLAVSKSNRYTYVQLIDDQKSHTLAHASAKEVGEKGKKKSRTEIARLVGELIAKRALELGVKTAVFDRRAYKYHGRIRALAEGARSAGLKI